MFTKFAVVLALSAAALGKVFITEPVSTTSWQAGVPQTVSWQDDGTTPDLVAFGPAIISIYVGNAQQQTSLQTITPSLDVSTAGSVQFTPDPTIGPNGNEYFIRIQSLSLMDPTTPTAPALSFSAKFTMTGMTGTFSPAVQAQIDGASTAPIGGATTPAVASTPAAATTTPTKLITTTSSSPTSSSSKASSSSATGTAGANAAKPSGAATSLSHSGFVTVAAAAAAIGFALY